MGKNTGKVSEFCQSGKVGNMVNAQKGYHRFTIVIFRQSDACNDF